MKEAQKWPTELSRGLFVALTQIVHLHASLAMEVMCKNDVQFQQSNCFPQLAVLLWEYHTRA